MVEPPIQAESHLFQTLQCADWLCGLIGRIGCYRAAPEEFPDFDWTLKYSGDRLIRTAPISGIRLQRQPPDGVESTHWEVRDSAADREANEEPAPPNLCDAGSPSSAEAA